MQLAYALCMKPLRIPSVTNYIRTHVTLYFMSYYFLPQRYKRDYVLSMNVDSDLKHQLLHAIHAMHLSHKFDNHLKVSYNTPHFTAVKIALKLNYKLR